MSALPSGRANVANYVMDTAYPAHFHREIMPVWLATTLASLGRRAPDLGRAFTWMELGCGAGLNTLVAAATYPQGRFIGIDLSEREIAQARRLAAEAGLENVEFICKDLQQVAQAAADQKLEPDCDFIVTNGVYSWVGESVRESIDRIIDRRLRPGGVAYICYLCHPGAASFAAAQRLMLMATQGHPGDTAAKARNSMNLLHILAKAGAGYFVEHPAATREMEQASKLSDAYLAHEFLNDERHVLHSSDMMRRFAAIDCEWIGSAMPLDNIDAVSLPASMQPVLAQLRQQGADAALLETVRDIARNQNLRLDLFQKSTGAAHGNRLGDLQHRQALLAQRVMLLPSVPDDADLPAELELIARIGKVTLPMQDVRPLLQALRRKPHSYAQLAELAAYADNPGFINQLLQVLAWKGWLHFLPPAHPEQDIQARAQRLQQVLNDAGHGRVRVQGAAGTALVYVN